MGLKEYESFKELISKNIIKILKEHFFIDIEKKIKFIKILTPWDVYSELGAEKGNAYGRRLSPKSVLKEVKSINDVSNLYIANATLGVPGVSVCMKTATVLFQKLIGKKIYEFMV